MKSMWKKIIILCVSALFAFAQIGCEREGTAEKAGKNIDKALDTTKEKINDATK